MKEKLYSFLHKHFNGRRAFIPLLAATSLLAALLFLVFPSEPLLPVHLTGGGAVAVQAAGSKKPSVAAKPTPVPASGSRYLSMNVGDSINLAPGPVSFGKYPTILSRLALSWRYRARVPGHTVLTVGLGKAKHEVFVFVSPVPSKQVSREDVDWYKTQFGTGTANCGPAVVAMSILWARGLDYSVEDIRDEIGYPYDDGAVSLDNLSDSLLRHKVTVSTPTLVTPHDLMHVLDQGHIALLLIQDSGITKTSNADPSADVVGRYYDDDEGHYILVKGYSLDGKYFVVYDPYPVDWETNGLRYDDDHTMIGKNRYYPSDEVFSSLKTQTALEVSPG